MYAEAGLTSSAHRGPKGIVLDQCIDLLTGSSLPLFYTDCVHPIYNLLRNAEEGRFFRGNLHCHSNRSDGLLEP